MKKLSLMLSVALLLPTSVAFAETALEVQADVQVNAGIGSRSENGGSRNDDAVSSENEEVEVTAAMNATATTNNVTGVAASEAHRSAVASFVKSLLADADRDGGIGAEVRAVAKSQQDAASTTAYAMVQVEKRGKLATFLFGSDWKNLGALRSQIAKTEADEKRLAAALTQTTDASVQADLKAQIDLLKAEKEKVRAFVDSHANAFSLFGWFTKLFVTSSTEVES